VTHQSSEHTLGMWAVSRNPSDFPNKFVARKWLIGRGNLMPTFEHHISDTLDGIRAMLPLGLQPIPRSPSDAPVIVESWI